MTGTPALRILSLGAGVQSTAQYLYSCKNPALRPDVAIFADTGWEPRAVYEHLDKLEAYGGHIIPIARVAAGNIRDDALDPEHAFTSMPLHVLGPEEAVEVVEEAPCTAPGCGWHAYVASREGAFLDDDYAALWAITQPTKPCQVRNNTGRVVVGTHTEVQRSGGLGRRQCTSEYKLKPIKRIVRYWLGYPGRTTVPRGVAAEMWIGISTDEIGRARDSDVGYLVNRHPLLELGWSRADCARYLKSIGWTGVTKSACLGCPFHGNRDWRRIRDTDPEGWADAVDFDRRIRHSRPGVEQFLHRSRLPLDEALIDRVTAHEWKGRQITIEDAVADQLLEEGDPDGCGPFTCRSGVRVA